MFTSKLRINLTKLQKLRDDLRYGKGTAVELLDSLVDSYRKFVVRRFDVFSHGGGTWRELKPATARRKRSRRILVDTKFMRLHLEAALKVIRRGPKSVTMGFISNVMHPDAQMSIAELLTIHNEGLGSVPQRPILVTPDDAARERQVMDLRSIMVRRLR